MKQQLIETLAKELYSKVWQDEDHGPENWPCCVNEATIAVEMFLRREGVLREFAARERRYRKEEAECGGDEVMESCYMLEVEINETLSNLKGDNHE